MSGRNISTNIRKICDLITYTEVNDIPAQITSYDFQKAFDKITYNCLFAALKMFNFGPNVIQWTKTLYTKFTARVQNNGEFSNPIDIERGVHQGGCCSSLYFLLCAELLAIQLRNNPEVQGVKINDIEYLLGLFADDTDNYMEHKSKPFETALSVIQNFGEQSGLKLNYDKTTVYRIGSIHNTNAMFYTQPQLAWTNDPVNILGVVVSCNEDQMTTLNYEPVVSKAKQTLFSWSNRTLSLLGKILIVNSLVASLFVYKMSVLPTIPANILKEINDIISKFLWNGKRPKIKNQILENNKANGGAGLVNMKIKDTAVKVKWIQTLYYDQNMANLVYELIHPILKENIWRINIASTDVQDVPIKNKFWTDVLRCWTLMNFQEQVDDPLNQIIWFNTHIKVGNTTVFWKEAYEQGLIYIRDLLTINGQIKNDEKIKNEFGINVMQINMIKSAIPKEWWQKIKKKIPNQTKTVYLYDEIVLKKNITSFAYKEILNSEENKNALYPKWDKWQRELNVSISYGEFLALFRNISKITNITKYRSFQYRLLNRVIFPGVKLHAWNIIGSPICVFCKLSQETICHLMYECKVVHDLWCDVLEVVAQKYNLCGEIRWSLSNVIFNNVAQPPSNVTNLIVLVVKQYIYAQRCKGKELSFNHVIAVINQLEKTEKYIATSASKLGTHMRKWHSESIELEQHNVDEYVQEYLFNV